MNARDYLVIDLEATCDDAGAVPKREMEIIEIGAVWVEGGVVSEERRTLEAEISPDLLGSPRISRTSVFLFQLALERGRTPPCSTAAVFTVFAAPRIHAAL